MRKIKAIAEFGLGEQYQREEVFEFPDNATEDEILHELWEWATQFVEIRYKEEGDDNENIS